MSSPNVVLIMSDQHRWDFIGYEDNGLTITPNIDRLAESGTIFDTAYCNSPLCSPSRASVMSGRYGINTGCFTNLHELPPGTPSFVEQFRQDGYHTCAIGKTHMEIHAYDSDLTSETHRRYMDSLGWDEVCETAGDRTFVSGITCSYSDFLESHGKLDEAVRFFEQWHYFMEGGAAGDPNFRCHEWSLEEAFHGTAFVGNRAVDWLTNAEMSEPFFLHVGFTAPHSPIAPTPETMNLYRDLPESPPWGDPSPPEWLPDGRRGYRAMITHIDEYIGRIMDCLTERGLADNTIVVYVSDHGEMAGDHQQFDKTSFHEGSVRVPLVLAGPGIEPNARSSALVELVDLGRTLCDLASVEPHSLDQGKSLAPILTGETSAHRETVYCEMGCDKMIRDDRYKLMWGDPQADIRQLGRLHLDKPVNIPPSPPKLFDLLEDPYELHDLSSEEGYEETRCQMMERLLQRVSENMQTQPNKSRGTYRPRRSQAWLDAQREASRT